MASSGHYHGVLSLYFIDSVHVSLGEDPEFCAMLAERVAGLFAYERFDPVL